MNGILIILIFIISNSAFAQSWKEDIITDARSIYTSISISTFSKPLYFKVSESTTVGGSAHHETGHLAVVIDKGLLESTRLTPDGFRMIICHELGHLFGGAPRRNVPMEWDGLTAHDGLSMMTSEGQADYYASLVCFRKMLDLEKSNSPRPDLSRVGPRLKHKCKIEAGFKGRDLEMCLRAGLAGEDFLKLVFEFPISCEKFDKSITPKIIRDSYPGRQCRLDTIISGALCNENRPLVLDFDQMENNGCGQEYGERPACWYQE